MADTICSTARAQVTPVTAFENDTNGPTLLEQLRQFYAMWPVTGEEEDRINRDIKAVVMRIQNLRPSPANAPVRARALLILYGGIEELLQEDDTPAGYLKAQLVASFAEAL